MASCSWFCTHQVHQKSSKQLIHSKLNTIKMSSQLLPLDRLWRDNISFDSSESDKSESPVILSIASNDNDEDASERTRGEDTNVDTRPSGDDCSGDDDEDELDEEELKILTVPILKQMLKKRHLKVSGRKAELIDRLMGQGEKIISKSSADATDADTEAHLTSLTNDELKKRLKKKGLKVSGKKAELVGRLMGREPPKVKEWKKSIGKLLLRKLINDKKSWVHNMEAKEIHESHQLFSCYPLSKFKEYLATLQQAAAAKDEIIRVNEREVLADLMAFPRGDLTDRGYPFWDTHPARYLLEEDVRARKSGNLEDMEPKQLWLKRNEYQDFPLAVFRDHIHQEKRKQREEPGWVVKRNKKGQKMHEKEVTAIKDALDSEQYTKQVNDMMKRWELLRVQEDSSDEDSSNEE